jgi:SpoVK/Ycf46/Vps4 family AAA+-type ATPase
MQYVTQSLAAGDIKKGIVGDSEATLNAIADRARLVPWDTCVILIEEIDSLVPERKGSDKKNNQNSSNDLIGVLLNIMDGSGMVPNLKWVCSTNLLGSIDEAVKRRLEI